MRITHSQTKDCHRSILASSVSIYLYVHSSAPFLLSRFLHAASQLSSTPQQRDLPLGGVRGTAGPPCVSALGDPEAPVSGRSDGRASPASERARSGPGSSEGLLWGPADRTGIPGGRPGSGSLKDKTPRFSRSDELLRGRGTELLRASAADEWARRMDSPECVISSSNCVTPPFTNNLSQLYRTHTETKGKPLPCSLPLPSPVRKGFIRARSTGEGSSLRGKFSSATARPFPPWLPQEPFPEEPRALVRDYPGPEPGLSSPAAGGRAGSAQEPEQGEPKALQQISSTVLVAGDMKPGAGKATRFPWANGGKTAKARPRIVLQQPIFLPPLVFLSITVKSLSSLPCLHFEQVHLPATMSTPLLYTIKNNNHD